MTRRPVSLEEVIEQADASRAAGQPAQAAALYEAWITENDSPVRCVALFNLGVLRTEMGDLDRAEAAYAEALAINPRLYQARINAGLVAERKRQDVDAVRHWLSVAEAAANGQAEAARF